MFFLFVLFLCISMLKIETVPWCQIISLSTLLTYFTLKCRPSDGGVDVK